LLFFFRCLLAAPSTLAPMCNIPLTDIRGLLVYRELMHREGSAAAIWDSTFGAKALTRKPDSDTLINLGKFSKFQSMKMPLDMQLKSIKDEHRAQSNAVEGYEKSIYAQKSDTPVSELSVKYFGDKAWHSRPPSQAAPCTYAPYKPPPTRWDVRKWDVDHVQFTREGLGPAHVASRELAEGSR